MLKQQELGQAGVQVSCVGIKACISRKQELEAEPDLERHVPLCDVGVLLLHPTPDSQVFLHTVKSLNISLVLSASLDPLPQIAMGSSAPCNS